MQYHRLPLLVGLSLLLLWSCNAADSDQEELAKKKKKKQKKHEVNHDTGIMFDLSIDHLSDEDNALVIKTLIDAYNELHDPDESVLESATLEREVVVPDNKKKQLRGSTSKCLSENVMLLLTPISPLCSPLLAFFRWFRFFFWIQSTEYCRFCGGLTSTVSIAEWEELFCDKLRTVGPAAFQDVFDCSIETLDIVIPNDGPSTAQLD